MTDLKAWWNGAKRYQRFAAIFGALVLIGLVGSWVF